MFARFGGLFGDGEMLKALKVGDDLEKKYRGSGLALAAVSVDGETLIDFAYCRDIDADFDEEMSPAEAAVWVSDSPRFQAHGQFFEVPGHSVMAFGMISCWEFVQL